MLCGPRLCRYAVIQEYYRLWPFLSMYNGRYLPSKLPDSQIAGNHGWFNTLIQAVTVMYVRSCVKKEPWEKFDVSLFST